MVEFLTNRTHVTRFKRTLSAAAAAIRWFRAWGRTARISPILLISNQSIQRTSRSNMLLVGETMRDTIDVEVEMVSAWAARNDLALNKSRGGRWWSRGGVVLFFLCHCCLMQRV